MSVHANLPEEITAANRRFMEHFRQSNISGVAACYTDDAQLLVPHMDPIRGRAAIEGVFKATSGQGHSLQFDTLELEGSEDSAIEIGQYTRKDRGGATLDRGKYLVIWKQVEGEWKIHRDMLSTSLPKQT